MICQRMRQRRQHLLYMMSVAYQTPAFIRGGVYCCHRTHVIIISDRKPTCMSKRWVKLQILGPDRIAIVPTDDRSIVRTREWAMSGFPAPGIKFVRFRLTRQVRRTDKGVRHRPRFSCASRVSGNPPSAWVTRITRRETNYANLGLLSVALHLAQRMDRRTPRIQYQFRFTPCILKSDEHLSFLLQ